MLKRKPCPVYNIDDPNKILKFQLQKMHQLVRENQLRSKERAKVLYDKKAKGRVYKVGEKVLVRNQNRKNKFSPFWEGPYIIKEVHGMVNVRLAIKGKHKIYHNNLVKSFKEKTNNNQQFAE